MSKTGGEGPQTISGAGPSAGSSAGYLPHIDGLRGVSVLLVVLYHAWPDLLPGGFIGVDVFFVISGFLITRLLLASRETGQFSYGGFLLRRVRRLWPGFALVVAVTLWLGWVLLEPDALADLGRSALAAMGFGSNWYFALSTDYFNDGLGQNLLLHSWSLAVEEQFYLIYPVVLLWMARSQTRLLAGLSTLWAISFAAMLVLPNDASAFFATHLRVWELASGALLWCIMAAIPKPDQTPGYAHWSGALGLIIIIATAALMPRSVWWPNLLTIAPVAGAILCIRFPWRVLEARWLVGMGLISYALYLWHWPILRALSTIAPGAPDGIVALAIFLSIGASYLAWRYVEEPVRRRRILAAPGALLGSFATVTLALGLVGWQYHAQDGFEGRFPSDMASIAATQADTRPEYASCQNGLTPLVDMFSLAPIAKDTQNLDISVCTLAGTNTSTPDVLYLGDSHLGAIQAELSSRMHGSGTNVLLVTLAACPPVTGLVFDAQGTARAQQCQHLQAQILKTIATGRIRQTVLVGHWDIYGGETGTRIPDFNTKLAAMVNTVTEQTELHILLDVPTHDFDVPRALIQERKWPWLGPADWLSRNEHEAVRAPYLAEMKRLERDGFLTLHDPVAAFCPEDICLGETEDGALYYDASHVSRTGAALLLDSVPDLPK